jgi:hypothetical protein
MRASFKEAVAQLAATQATAGNAYVDTIWATREAEQDAAAPERARNANAAVRACARLWKAA